MDEAYRAQVREIVDELYRALVEDQNLRFWEGGIVQVAPVGAAPEYITVEIEGIYDGNVLWRGIPGTLNIGDEVIVWENPNSKRREIIGAGGAAGAVTLSATWDQVYDSGGAGAGRQSTVDTGSWQAQATGFHAMELQRTEATNSAVIEVLRLIALTSNVAHGAAGLGGRVLMQLEDSGGVTDDAAYWDWIWYTGAAGAEESYFEWGVMAGGAAAAQYGRLFYRGWTGRTFAFLVKNTSGGAVFPNDVGYIDEAGEFKTTATQYDNKSWCVVITPGLNNTDIWVTRRGRVTVHLDANCNVGDFLYTSGTATQASVLAYVRPEVFAVALTANVGGAGGTCEAMLLCHRTDFPRTSANFLFSRGGLSSDSDFSTTINAVAGAVVTYNWPGVGDDATIVPNAATDEGKVILHNTTRGDYAYISTVNTGAFQITLTAAAPGAWAPGDTITTRSQTNLGVIGTSRYFDVDASGILPALSVGIILEVAYRDTAAVPEYCNHHPWETYGAGKVQTAENQRANGYYRRLKKIPVTAQRYTVLWTASGAPGAGTAAVDVRIAGYVEAAP